MAGASMFFGGLLGFSSFWNMPCSLHGCPDTFKRAIHPMKDDSASKKIARVADETLQVIGKIFGSIAGMVMAVQMVSGATSVGFCASVLAGATLATPYVLIGVSCFVLGALARIHGGPSYVEPSVVIPDQGKPCCSGSGSAAGRSTGGVEKPKDDVNKTGNVGGNRDRLGARLGEGDGVEGKGTDSEAVEQKLAAIQKELADAKAAVEQELPAAKERLAAVEQELAAAEEKLAATQKELADAKAAFEQELAAAREVPAEEVKAKAAAEEKLVATQQELADEKEATHQPVAKAGKKK